MIDNLLKYILLTPNLISKEKCKKLIDYYNSLEQYQLGIFDAESTNSSEQHKSQWRNDTSVRNTWSVKTNNKWWINFQEELLKPYMSEYIIPYYNTKIYGCEPAQFLKYEVGGHYDKHIDGESLYVSGNGELPYWRRNVKRDYSTLLYLNENFEGGEFEFPELNIKLKPTTGTMITFPSDHRFLHTALPVTKGVRYCLVIWSLTEQSHRLFDESEKNNLPVASYY